MERLLQTFTEAAARPHQSARVWKARTGRPVVGTFPMHFPAEVAHAAGALTAVVQASDESITVGGGSFYQFFCGYTRSVVDQATKGELDYYDTIMFGDHCVQMLSAADVVRVRRPNAPCAVASPTSRPSSAPRSPTTRCMPPSRSTTATAASSASCTTCAAPGKSA